MWLRGSLCLIIWFGLVQVKQSSIFSVCVNLIVAYTIILGRLKDILIMTGRLVNGATCEGLGRGGIWSTVIYSLMGCGMGC